MIRSSSHCASRVESGGLFLRMGPASRTIVWTGFAVADSHIGQIENGVMLSKRLEPGQKMMTVVVLRGC